MNKQAKIFIAVFSWVFLFGLAFGAAALAANLLNGEGIVSCLFLSLLSASILCLFIHRQIRGFRNAGRALPPQIREQLDGLLPQEQFETLSKLYVTQCRELDSLSVDRFLSRLLSDNSHTNVIENLGEHLKSILHSNAFGYRWTYFCLAYIQLEDYEAYILKEYNNQLFLSDFRQMYDVVAHAFLQMLEPPHLAHSIERKNSCVFLVNLSGSTPDSLRETLNAQVDSICDACRGIIKHLSDSFNLTIQVSVSAPFCDITETYSTFAWLQTLREYVDFMCGTFPVLGPKDYDKYIVAPNTAPPNLGKKYYSALLSEDYIQAEQALCQMGNYVLARDAFSISNLKLVMVQCLSTAEEIAATNHAVIANVDLDWRRMLDTCESQNQLEGIIHKFFAGLISRADSTERKGTSTAQRIAAYLDEHYCSPNLSVVTLADQFSLSQSYISRIFKKQIGLSIPDYIHEKRIRKAKQLLLTTSLTLNEISEQVGYSTQWTFNRAFKRLVDVTPSTFRQLSKQR